MSKIRINELARQLEIPSHVIVEMLPEVGVNEKKTHSSLIDEPVAELVRKLVQRENIAQQSGVSLGTVYQYFADRDDIVATLAGESALRMLHLGADFWDAATGRLGLRRSSYEGPTGIVGIVHDACRRRGMTSASL